MKPPGLARFILRVLTPSQDKAVLLGDMDEGFYEKSSTSLRGARLWYWQQTLKSLPYLCWERLTSRHAKAIAAILSVTFMGYVFIHLWDVFAARGAAQYVARHTQSVPLEHVRKLYFFVYMVGSLMVGALIATTIFSKNRTFWVNTVLFVGPIAAVIFTDSFIRFLLADTPHALTYFLQRIGLSFPALMFGAFIGMRLLRPSDK